MDIKSNSLELFVHQFFSRNAGEQWDFFLSLGSASDVSGDLADDNDFVAMNPDSLPFEFHVGHDLGEKSGKSLKTIKSGSLSVNKVDVVGSAGPVIMDSFFQQGSVLATGFDIGKDTIVEVFDGLRNFSKVPGRLDIGLMEFEGTSAGQHFIEGQGPVFEVIGPSDFVGLLAHVVNIHLHGFERFA